MTHRAFEQAHYIAALFALLDQRKHRIKHRKEFRHHLRRMLGTDIHAVTCQIAFAQHLLRDKGLVGQRIWTLKGEPRERRQTPVIDLEAVFIGECLPALPNVQAGMGDGVPDLTRSMTSKVLRAAVGPIRSVQKVLLIKVVCAASMTSRLPMVAVTP